MNERDSEAVAALLRSRGYSIVEAEADADTVLLNTCAVRDQAEQKAIGKASHLLKRKRKNPDFKVGILGCMAQNRGIELLDRIPDLDLLIGTQKFHRVPELLDQRIASIKGLGVRPSTLVDLEEEEGSQNEIRHHLPEEKTRASAFVSIMQGCNMRCSFCIVPKTRGAERCRSIEDIVSEVRGLSLQGTREITLLGQIVTSYGRREIAFKEGKSPFVQLIEAVATVDGIDRIRFTSPHPRGFKDDLIDAYATIPKLMPYVHLPVQSGSNQILKAMNRPYSAERYLEIVNALKTRVPEICISTDVIVGFPSETDEDFEATVQLFDQVQFDMAYIFKYSPRTGTRSATVADDVSDSVKEDRNQILLDRLGKYSLARNQSMVGTIQQVLIEGPAKRGEDLFQGKTPNYRKVILKASPEQVGRIVPVSIENSTVTVLLGNQLNRVES
jgi:tRNA-2-methylthio-N6-dimethylallyladenosine synthase